MISKSNTSALLKVLYFAVVCLGVTSVAVHLVRSSKLSLPWSRAAILQISSESKFAYISPTGRPELSSHEQPSKAQVLENGVPVSTHGNAPIDDIRRLGNGRYAFWHDAVYYSTSDNTNPRTNGRRYEISYPRTINRTRAHVLYGLTALTFLFSLLLTGREIHRSKVQDNWFTSISRIRVQNRIFHLFREAGLHGVAVVIACWLLAAVFVCASSLVYLNRVGVLAPLWSRVSLEHAQPEIGFAYIAPTGRPFLSSHQKPSSAIVLENGIPLPGKGNSLHDDIRSVGRGRYSFWHDYVYFSASDNSDPRTNGRQYQISCPATIGSLIAYSIYIATLVIAVAAILISVGSRDVIHECLRRFHARTFHALSRRIQTGSSLEKTSPIRFAPKRIQATMAPPNISWLRRWLKRFQPTITLSSASPVQQHRILIATLLVSLILLSISLLALLNRNNIVMGTWRTSPVRNIRHELDFAYLADTTHPELSSHEHPSVAQMFEDGKPLAGPANSLHENIRKLGRGSYSFWHEYIYFSASDNTDPATNGRRYEIYYPYTFSAPLACLLWLLTFFQCAFSLRLLLSTADFQLSTRSLIKSPTMMSSLIVFGIYLIWLLIKGYGRIAQFYPLAVHFACFAVSAGFAFALAKSVFRKSVPFLSIAKISLRMIVAAFSIVSWILLSNPTMTGVSFTTVISSITDAILPGTIAGLFIYALFQTRLIRESGIYNLEPSWFQPFWKLQLRHVCLTIILAIALIFSMTAIIKVWDCSPWMDSQTYDELAHDLAVRGKLMTQFYMPLYIFWLGGLFYVFGHFYFVVQVSNVLLVIVTLAFFYAAIRRWIQNESIALLTTFLLTTSMTIIHSYIHLSQIETFNEFLVALNFYFFVRIYKERRSSMSILLGLSWAALVLCRLQNLGLIFGQFLVLFVACIKSKPPSGALSWKRLLNMLGPAIIAVLLPLVLWGVRNRFAEGHFRIGTTAPAWQLALGNHPETRGGIDYRSYFRLQTEYAAKYPDPVERDKAYQRDGIRFLVESPQRTLYNFYMRAKVFLNILEPGFWENRKTNWRIEWPDFVYWRFQSILSLVALLYLVVFNRGRLAWITLILIFLYMVPYLPFPAGESRIRYPIDHLFLLGIAVMICDLAAGKKTNLVSPNLGSASGSHQDSDARLGDANQLKMVSKTRKRYVCYVLGFCGAGICAILCCRLLFGAPNANSPLRASGAVWTDQISVSGVDESIQHWEEAWAKSRTEVVGGTIDMNVIVSNFEFPPPYFAPQPFPEVCTEPGQACYMCTLNPRISPAWAETSAQTITPAIVLSYKNASVPRGLREGDRAHILGKVLAIKDFDFGTIRPVAYIRVQQVRKLLSP
jgi:hypothetical protein